MAKDNEFTIVFNKFHQGFAPAWFKNSLSEFGNGGNANAMTNVNVLDPTLMTQGPGLASLTNGTQAGALEGLLAHVLDKAVASDVTYGIGTTKLHKISSTAVTNSGGVFPHAITGCTDGESVLHHSGALYYFFNKSSGGDIGKYDLSSTFDDDWGSTVPTGAAALQSAPHPSAQKEDLIVFGNGRYVGTYIGNSTTLAPTKLDFGADAVVADVWFNQNKWWIVVNNPDLSGSNRSVGQIYIWDGGALESILEDETGVGYQRIGFGYVVNGITYLAYQDLTSSGFKIGYLSGYQIKPLGAFTGSLPNFAQKTLYENTILFPSSGSIYAAGTIDDNLPWQISQLADGGYATVGALAAPFGTPLVASSDGGTNFRLAKFSGYDTACNWTSLVIPIGQGRYQGHLDYMTVMTKNLGTSARADVTVKINQEQTSLTACSVTTASKRRHVFAIGKGGVEDLRVYVSWANGNATNDCGIRSITLSGHYEEVGL